MKEKFCQMLYKRLSVIKILAVLPDALIGATCISVKPLPLICVVYAMFCRIYRSKGGGKGGKKRERGGEGRKDAGRSKWRKGEKRKGRERKGKRKEVERHVRKTVGKEERGKRRQGRRETGEGKSEARLRPPKESLDQVSSIPRDPFYQLCLRALSR